MPVQLGTRHSSLVTFLSGWGSGHAYSPFERTPPTAHSASGVRSVRSHHSSLITCHFSLRPARPVIGSVRKREEAIRSEARNPLPPASLTLRNLVTIYRILPRPPLLTASTPGYWIWSVAHHLSLVTRHSPVHPELGTRNKEPSPRSPELGTTNRFPPCPAIEQRQALPPVHPSRPPSRESSARSPGEQAIRIAASLPDSIAVKRFRSTQKGKQYLTPSDSFSAHCGRLRWIRS